MNLGIGNGGDNGFDLLVWVIIKSPFGPGLVGQVAAESFEKLPGIHKWIESDHPQSRRNVGAPTGPGMRM